LIAAAIIISALGAALDGAGKLAAAEREREREKVREASVLESFLLLLLFGCANKKRVGKRV